MPLLFIINPGRRDLGIFTKTTILLKCSLVRGRICISLIHCTFAISSHNNCIELKTTVMLRAKFYLNYSFHEKSEFELKAAASECPNTSVHCSDTGKWAGRLIYFCWCNPCFSSLHHVILPVRPENLRSAYQKLDCCDVAVR